VSNTLCRVASKKIAEQLMTSLPSIPTRSPRMICLVDIVLLIVNSSAA
jgi:hypothetical protein